MVQFRKLADGTWARFGDEFADEDWVSISLGSGDTRDLEGEPAVLKLASALFGEPVEGKFTYALARAHVEKMIRDGLVGRSNVILIEAWDNRVILNAYALAKHDLIARHRDIGSAISVPKGFHDYSIYVYCVRPDRPMRVGGSLELVQLIKERLARQFSGRICDPAGQVLDEWEVEAAQN
jgi:hypothetical protein